MPTTSGFVNRLSADRNIDQDVLAKAIAACKTRFGSEIVDVEAILDHLVQFSNGVDAVFVESSLEADYDRESLRHLDLEYQALRGLLLERVVATYGEVDADDARRLLHPLMWGLGRSLSARTLPVFTLNYDMAVETYVDQYRDIIEIVDGFDRSPSASVRRWERGNLEEAVLGDPSGHYDIRLLLFKLHGSTSWARDLESREIHQIGLVPKDTGRYQTLLHYPSADAKPTFEEPYRTGFDFFWTCVPRARAILVMGTSFRDASVKEALLRASNTARIVVNTRSAEPEFVSEMRAQGLTIEYVPGDLNDAATRDALIHALVRDPWRYRRDSPLVTSQPSAGLYRAGDQASGLVLDGDIVVLDTRAYLVEAGQLRHIPDIPTLTALGFTWNDVHSISRETASALGTGDPIMPQLQDGTIIQAPNDERVFVAFNQRLRHVADVDTLEVLIPARSMNDGSSYRYYDVRHDVSDDTVRLSQIGRPVRLDSFAHNDLNDKPLDGTRAVQSILAFVDTHPDAIIYDVERELGFGEQDALDLLILRLTMARLLVPSEDFLEHRRRPSKLALTDEGRRALEASRSEAGRDSPAAHLESSDS